MDDIKDRLKDDLKAISDMSYTSEQSIGDLKNRVEAIKEYIQPVSSMSVAYLRKALVPLNYDGRHSDNAKRRKFEESQKLVIEEIKDTLSRYDLLNH